MAMDAVWTTSVTHSSGSKPIIAVTTAPLLVNSRGAATTRLPARHSRRSLSLALQHSPAQHGWRAFCAVYVQHATDSGTDPHWHALRDAAVPAAAQLTMPTNTPVVMSWRPRRCAALGRPITDGRKLCAAWLTASPTQKKNMHTLSITWWAPARQQFPGFQQNYQHTSSSGYVFVQATPWISRQISTRSLALCTRHAPINKGSKLQINNETDCLFNASVAGTGMHAAHQHSQAPSWKPQTSVYLQAGIIR